MQTFILDEDCFAFTSKVYRFKEQSFLSVKIKNFLIYAHLPFYILMLFFLLKIDLLALMLLFPILFFNVSFLSFLTDISKSKTTLINLKDRTVQFHRAYYRQELTYDQIKVYLVGDKVRIVSVKAIFPISFRCCGVVDQIYPSAKDFFEQLEKNGVEINSK